MNNGRVKKTDKMLVPILMADDDESDRVLTRHAFEESCIANPFYFVRDGEELMEFLHRRGAYCNALDAPRPGLILLDLNMPRKNGWEALQEIKADASLCHIPVVVLTTSQQKEDVLRSYDLGVNSFIIKPVKFDQLVQIARCIGRYWLEIGTLPPAI
ncbi:MAG: response regulator [Synechococcales bacterium]|nr:response regulator [Synechococcales bacterium]